MVNATSFGANKGLDLSYFLDNGVSLVPAPQFGFNGSPFFFSFFNNSEKVRVELSGQLYDASNFGQPLNIINTINIYDGQTGQTLLHVEGVIVDLASLNQTVFSHGNPADLIGFPQSLPFASPPPFLGPLTYNGTAASEKFGGTPGNDIFNANFINFQNQPTGADTFAGYGGNDSYFVHDGATKVLEALGAGNDTVYSFGSYALIDVNDPGSNGYYGVEDLVLVGDSSKGTGNALDNHITGSGTDEILDARNGADTVHGGFGNDSIIGGPANELGGDQLFGDESNDTIFGGGGHDCLDGGSADDSLDGGLGNDTVHGGPGNDYIASGPVTESGKNLLLGDEDADTLYGGAGADTLDGGTGIDSMVGGAGPDDYYVDETDDAIVEDNVGLSIKDADEVFSTATYTLSSYIEILYLLTKNSIDGTGNDQDNHIYGNVVNNVITALGGDDYIDGGGGADSLLGGAGDDTYIVYDHFDEILEQTGEGHDVVFASGSYTLSANIEDLTLTGHASISGGGNDLGNIIIGNDNDNRLDGGAGADSLTGGAGNDVYGVDDLGDVVTEKAGQGTDGVESSVSFTLPGNIENLHLTGADAIDGMGNAVVNIIIGNDAANSIDGKAGGDSMAGMDGDDAYYVDNGGDVVAEAFGQGHDIVFSRITYQLTSDVEDLTLLGTGNISGYGNGLGNAITGNSGKNLLNGLAGNDTMAGGDGNDSYVADSSGDVINEAPEHGTDQVASSADYTLSGNVENLILTGSDNLKGTGNALGNSITGNSGNNVLDGGTSSGPKIGPVIAGGNDTMAGGLGDDTYAAHHSGDLIKELFNQGADLVAADASFTLAANIENLMLLGETGINATGNTLANGILGNAGNNVIDGKAGADSMAGQGGDDRYIVDNAGDGVSERTGEGNDTVWSSVSYTLPGNVEDLVLIAGGPLNGTGNTLDNHITGGGGNNILNGGGGSDTMMGAGGNDVYIVDDLTDSVQEDASGGIDAVRASLSWTLASNFEVLSLTGSGAIDGTGNDAANTLAGNANNNILDGGLGADSMAGGLGNDLYVVDNAGDVVAETGAGNDTVNTTLNSYTLPANVEALTFGGTGNFAGTGNSGANSLFGGEDNDTLDGKVGADLMTGGDGDDLYVVDNAGDVIVEDAIAGTDTVRTSIAYTLGNGLENLTGTGTAGITLTGNGAANIITGNSGNNSLSGAGGDDTLNGGLGNDKLSGGAGLDRLIGGAGADQLTGGDDADIFVFQALSDLSTSGTLETITDFSHVQGDKIDLSGIDADATAPGDQAFNFLGNRSFTSHAGDLIYSVALNAVTVFGDVDGDGAADFALKLNNVASLTAGDFIL